MVIYLYLFAGDIDSRSIKDQHHTKTLWEAKLAEDDVKLYPDHKPNNIKQSPNTSTDVNYHVQVTNVLTASHDNKNEKESAIDRDIRLAHKREAELQAEKELRSQEQQSPHGSQSDESIMTIYKVPKPTTVVDDVDATKVNDVDVPPLPTSPIPLYKDLSDHSVIQMTEMTESIIDREIREQREREQCLQQPGYIEHIQVNKVSVPYRTSSVYE
jgi:hypothetical protein